MAVMYNWIFQVDPKYVKDGKYQFDPTGNGEMILAAYNGKMYFVKRDMHLRYPAPDDSDAVKEKKQKEVKEREYKQEKLRELMRGLNAFTDHIVVEDMNFGDEDLQFVTVTAYIPDAFPKKHNYSSMSEDMFKNLALKTAKCLVVLHGRGVIHGDLKEDNILVKKEAYAPYLIDFDTSYPASEIPRYDGIGGTDGYHSPEVLLYGSDEDAAPSSTITPAVDIFSLGVVLHRWWTNSFPAVDHGKCWIGEAVFLDKKVFIDKKFNIPIGPKYETTYSSLLNWMFAKDYTKRPTAKEVVAVLSDAQEVPDEFLAGSDKDKFDTELWPAHIFIASLYSVDKLKEKNIKSFRRINDGSGSDGLKYYVKCKTGEESALSIDEVIRLGFCERKDAVVGAPWEEHFIEFESPATISEKGYAKIERVEQSYRKRYVATTLGGRTIDKNVELLISEGLAHPKKEEVESDTPWPEDGAAYNEENMAKAGVKKISRMEVGGKHAYQIVYKDGHTSPPARAKNLLLMGFFKK
jgi:serine/threonine protein kinase